MENSSMNPRISVLLPVYNGEAYVAKALDSVLRQSYPAYEIVVVDDGSTDRTPEILDRYQGKILRTRIPNGGVANARNIALSMATGDWIAFVDHDDVWFKEKLEKQTEFVRRYTDVGFISTNYFLRSVYFGNRMRRHFEGLRNRSKMTFDAPMKNAFEVLLSENFVGTSSAVMIRKDVVSACGGFDRQHVVGEDYYYWLRCARRTAVMALSEPLFYKRTHEKNLSNDWARIYQFNRVILRDIAVAESDYIQEKRLEPALRASLARFAYDLGDICWNSGRSREAFDAYHQAYAEHKTLQNLFRYLFTVSKRSLRLLGGVPKNG